MKLCLLIVGFCLEIVLARYVSRGFMIWPIWTQGLFMIAFTYLTGMLVGLYLLSIDREVDSPKVKVIPLIAMFWLAIPFFVILENQPSGQMKGLAVCVVLAVLAEGFWTAMRLAQLLGLLTLSITGFILKKWDIPNVFGH